ncbi:MAG: hypothetical protein KIT02_12205 [Devosia sp.]|uniref:N-acyl amino acid synthase FeeM domain-containing protein n=1 Tax=Devosia sp. TaxID=1871048 RepID=UPI0024CD4089|nr:acyl-homoserine-lactone synthase [Devosia sp.]UYN98698.1 MAG: hypothetical protein KIT02_12205 [Devosia sp.]
MDILDRVEYRRVSPVHREDPVYRLRYEAYRRENFVPVNDVGMTRDAYDDAPNCRCFGVYIDNQLVSSIRLHVVTAGEPTSPSRTIWPDVLGGMLERGESYIDPSRFTADHEASLAFPALPYLTLRLAVMACEYYQTTHCISSVRPEHGAFYRRIFALEQLAGEGFWGELTFPVCLFGARVEVIYDRVMRRFPFFLSTPEERAALFTEPGLQTTRVRPSARQVQRLDMLSEVG